MALALLPWPETQQLSRWLKDFSSHATLSGVGKGGWAAGFLMCWACSPWGPSRMSPPSQLAGSWLLPGTHVPREAWEGGSLCPASKG